MYAWKYNVESSTNVMQQAVHIVLALPLNNSSRACIFINTSPIDQHTFVLKPTFLLKQEPDDSEDVMCNSLKHILNFLSSRLKPSFFGFRLFIKHNPHYHFQKAGTEIPTSFIL
jgi:hypothetical protein